jgi:Na+/H+ antiporter NhaD/arsenite permease-like protein
MFSSIPSISACQAARSVLQPFLKDRLLHILLAIGLFLSVSQPSSAREYPGWVHWPTIYTLAGLMLLTKGIERSGYLDHIGRLVIRHLHHERALALFFATSTALLSTVLTNDIALFIVVPLTIGLRNLAGLPIGRLVIFEAMAANAGSMLTPIGNPQNILLWQRSHLPFWVFVVQMAPLALGVVALLLLATVLAFPGQQIHAEPPDHPVAWHSKLLTTCVLLYISFVIVVEFGHPGWGFLVVLACMLVFFRRVLFDVDWSLIAVFVLMFIDIRLMTELDFMKGGLDVVAHYTQPQLFLAGVIGSQLISNLPATILLMKYASASKVIAYAVNAGGFGFVLGSLANLIALRMVDERGIWLRFHLYSVPFLIITSLLAYGLL